MRYLFVNNHTVNQTYQKFPCRKCGLDTKIKWLEVKKDGRTSWTAEELLNRKKPVLVDKNIHCKHCNNIVHVAKKEPREFEIVKNKY